MGSRVCVSSVGVLLLAAALPGQGVVNPSLLRVPDGEVESVIRRAGFAGVHATARQSVVWVAVEVDGERGKYVFERASSGVIVDGSGLVATWGRLVQEVAGADDKRLFVQLDDAGNTKLDATVVRVDQASGLALLRVVPPAAGLRA
ncbi:MAG: hypothetical protein WBO45_07680, partial [Planctomycetota bacterium]